MFDAVPVGVSVTSGRDHRLIYLNPAYRAIVGERRCGRPMREVFADLRHERYFALLDQVYATGEAVRVEETPLRLSGRDERLCGWPPPSAGSSSPAPTGSGTPGRRGRSSAAGAG
ncbi:PAS domain-containing protein [Nonomuraea maritima]|uniref:PAS domain-containing protein n=1 Tax=Nonomuraea maritima TaxID=683260 RepID=UPI000B86B335